MSLNPYKPSRQSWECDRCALLVPIRYRIETPVVVA